MLSCFFHYLVALYRSFPEVKQRHVLPDIVRDNVLIIATLLLQELSLSLTHTLTVCFPAYLYFLILGSSGIVLCESSFILYIFLGHVPFCLIHDRDPGKK